MARHTLEQLYQVWNDEDGSRFEIGPDRDSLGCVEIRCCAPDGKIEARITMQPEAWDLLRRYRLDPTKP